VARGHLPVWRYTYLVSAPVSAVWEDVAVVYATRGRLLIMVDPSRVDVVVSLWCCDAAGYAADPGIDPSRVDVVVSLWYCDAAGMLLIVVDPSRCLRGSSWYTTLPVWPSRVSWSMCLV